MGALAGIQSSQLTNKVLVNNLPLFFKRLKPSSQSETKKLATSNIYIRAISIQMLHAFGSSNKKTRKSVWRDQNACNPRATSADEDPKYSRPFWIKTQKCDRKFATS